MEQGSNIVCIRLSQEVHEVAQVSNEGGLDGGGGRK